MERIDNLMYTHLYRFRFFLSFFLLYFAFAVEKYAHKSYFFYRETPPSLSNIHLVNFNAF